MYAVVPQMVISAVQRALPRIDPAVISAFLTRHATPVLAIVADLGQKGINLVTHFVDEFLDSETTDSTGNGSPPPSDDDDDNGNDSDDHIIKDLKCSSEKLPKNGNEKYNVYLRKTNNPQQAQIDFNRFSGKTISRGDKQTTQLNDGRVAILYNSTKHMPGVRTIAIQRPNGNVIVKFRYPESFN